MKYVDIENWERKNHYNYFNGLDYPHFSICGNLDITKFYRFIKENEYPFFASFLYTVVQTANSIKEFRYRIQDNKVIEHNIVYPSFTIMTEKQVFSFCTVPYIENFNDFLHNTLKVIELAKGEVNLEDEPGRDDLLYITSMPWVSFTGISHPIHMSPVDSIPRITWGKFFEENGVMKLPFSLQTHHALLDGSHVGQYFIKIQELLDNPYEKLAIT
jgi:chloramphenicol O-acetyltransferase type A